MKNKPVKTNPWSPRYMGYRAWIEGAPFCIIAQNRIILRRLHRRFFPELKFDPKKCHPAKIKRVE